VCLVFGAATVDPCGILGAATVGVQRGQGNLVGQAAVGDVRRLWLPPARVALAEPSVIAAATAVLAISLIVVFTGISGDWLLA
jgi:hypothetical protein